MHSYKYVAIYCICEYETSRRGTNEANTSEFLHARAEKSHIFFDLMEKDIVWDHQDFVTCQLYMLQRLVLLSSSLSPVDTHEADACISKNFLYKPQNRVSKGLWETSLYIPWETA